MTAALAALALWPACDDGGDAGADSDGDGGTCATGADHAAADPLLCDLVVTYVHVNGFFAQEGATGPGLQFCEGSGWTADAVMAVGATITLAVTEVHSYEGNEEVTDHGTITYGTAATVEAQDLSAGTQPSKDLEAELVTIAGATVTAVDGRNVTVSYGTATEVLARVPPGVAASFCVGAAFDVTAPVTEWATSSSTRCSTTRLPTLPATRAATAPATVPRTSSSSSSPSRARPST